jgi:hypothetical protein
VDVCCSLEAEVRQSRALADWAHEPEVGRFSSIDEVIDRIRQLDVHSDELLAVLLRLVRGDRRAVAVMIVGLLPLALGRCGRSAVGGRADDLVAELALAIVDASERGLEGSTRRIANVLLDRAWAELRRPARRITEPTPADPTDLARIVVDAGPDPADFALARVQLDGVLRMLATAGRAQSKTIRAWNTAVALAERDERSEAERYQLKYARKVLRRSLRSHLVA